MLNPWPPCNPFCAKRGIKLCADCISSDWLVPVTLNGFIWRQGPVAKVWRGYPGLCMVYYNHLIASTTALPRYLDLAVVLPNIRDCFHALFQFACRPWMPPSNSRIGIRKILPTSPKSRCSCGARPARTWLSSDHHRSGGRPRSRDDDVARRNKAHRNLG